MNHPDNHADRHVWEFRWVRDLIVIAIIALILLAIYSARSVVAPALFGLVFAYVLNPIVTWIAKRDRISRAQATGALLFGLALIVVILGMLITPVLAGQIDRLFDNLQNYAQWTTDKFEKHAAPYLQQVTDRLEQSGQQPADGTNTPDTAQTADTSETANTADNPNLNSDSSSIADIAGTPSTTQPTTQPTTAEPTQALTKPIAKSAENIDLSTIGSVLLSTANHTISVIGAAVGTTTYIILFMVVAVFSFFFFSWKLDRIIAWCAGLIPRKNRKRTFEIIAMMDTTIAAFIRGRLIQSMAMGTVLSIGWGIVGVPYWLALGLLGGLLNLAPFLASLAWILAVILAVVDLLSTSGFEGWGHLMLWSILLPTLIYACGQFLDGWVIEPIVQGSATNLDPLTVLLAVLIGGSLAGMLGLILAIPLAACIKILAAELVLPTYRQWANRETAPE